MQANKEEVVERVPGIIDKIENTIVEKTAANAAAAVAAVIVLMFYPATENNTLTSKFIRRL